MLNVQINQDQPRGGGVGISSDGLDVKCSDVCKFLLLNAIQ